MNKLILIGAGGYAKSVIDSINFFHYKIEGFIDEFSKEHYHLGFPIIGHSLDDLFNSNEYSYFICIGNNEKRKMWYDRLVQKRYNIINIIDKTAIISPNATLGTGCFVGKMAIINSKSIVGNNCIINTKTLVEHGCKVNDHANISTNAVINGDVEIGEGSFIGSCSVTIGQISIGRWSTVGAGAVVVKSFGDGVTVAGIPAKIIKRGAMLG